MSLKTISYSAVVIRLLANHRQIKGLEQADVAKALGIAPSSYSRLETGQTTLTIDTIFRIAEIVGVDVPSLMQEAQRVIQKVGTTSEVQIAPISRSNTTEPGVGTFVTGAALGALIAAILSR